MKRVNFTFDNETIQLLERLSELYYHGNKSLTVRAALESLAAHTGHAGWVVAGYSPVPLEQQANCHSCGQTYSQGEILYRPVFRRGESRDALPQIPNENWLDCSNCVQHSGVS